VTLQQLRFICEVVKTGMNVSKAATSLCTSQPSMSRQILELEREIGVKIFLRSKRRLLGLTKPGEEVLALARKALRTTDSLRQIRNDFSLGESGTFVIGVSHTHASSVLPKVVQEFSSKYPKMGITLRQGNPTQIAEWVSSGEANISISAAPPSRFTDIAFLPCYDEHKIVLTPQNHPLLGVKCLTIEALSHYPIITYDSTFTTNTQVFKAFAKKGREPNIVLSAANPDVMKPYVRRGLGIAIVGDRAFDKREDRGLAAIDAKHLFESATIYCGILKHSYVKRYVIEFIRIFEPRMTERKVIEAVE